MTLGGPRRGPVQLQHPVRSDTDEGAPESRGRAVRLCRPGIRNGATECIYRVTVTVVDGAGGSDATGVNIEVDDRIRGSVRAGPSHRSGDGEVEHEPRRELERAPRTPVPPLPAMTCSTVKAAIFLRRWTRRHRHHLPPFRVPKSVIVPEPGSTQHHLRGAGKGEEWRARRAPGRERARGGPTGPTTSRYSMTDQAPARERSQVRIHHLADDRREPPVGAGCRKGIRR